MNPIPPTDIRETLADSFEASGLSPAAAAGMASMVEGLVEIRLRSVLVAKFSALRQTVFGEALFRELAGDDGECQADAARRLHCNPAVLRRERARIRKLLAEP